MAPSSRTRRSGRASACRRRRRRGTGSLLVRAPVLRGPRRSDVPKNAESPTTRGFPLSLSATSSIIRRTRPLAVLVALRRGEVDAEVVAVGDLDPEVFASLAVPPGHGGPLYGSSASRALRCGVSQ